MRVHRLFLLLLCLALFAYPEASTADDRSPFATRGRCGPFPKLVVSTPDWLCVGYVAGPEHGLFWPRSIIEVGAGRLIVTDAVGWYARGHGRILELTLGRDGGVALKPLMTNRNLPHGLAIGPDNLLYVGDDNQIWRFNPSQPQSEPQVVLDGLPGKNSSTIDLWHPFKQIVFDRENNLIVNFGAPSDVCEKPERPTAALPCKRSEGAHPDAALWRLSMKWPEGTPGAFEPMARGLRNSMAIAINPRSGQVIQAENNIDKWNGRLNANVPPEEMNLIEEGKNYGWPYCVGFGQVVPEYAGKIDCRKFKDPYFLLPAHSAPLAMSYYDGPMFPELNGKLVVALHGFARNGHRIVAYDTDASGLPRAPPGKRTDALFPATTLLSTSGSAPTNIIRPSGMAIARDGSIWLVDDKAKAVLVILRDKGGNAGERGAIQDLTQRQDRPPPPAWDRLYKSVLIPRCGFCHEAFVDPDSAHAWKELRSTGFIDPSSLKDSAMFKAMLGELGGRQMPPPPEPKLTAADLALVRNFIGE